MKFIKESLYLVKEDINEVYEDGLGVASLSVKLGGDVIRTLKR